MGGIPELRVKQEVVTSLCTIREPTISLFHLDLCSPISSMSTAMKTCLIPTPSNENYSKL